MNKIVVAVVVREGKVLMTRRRNAEGCLRWQFPGGSIEVHEPGPVAAEREVFEETNVSCRARQILGERVHPDTRREILYVLCDYRGGNAWPKEPQALDRAEWMNPSDVFQVVTSDLFPPVKRLLRELSA